VCQRRKRLIQLAAQQVRPQQQELGHLWAAVQLLNSVPHSKIGNPRRR
jgi:hypothetical protein